MCLKGTMMFAVALTSMASPVVAQQQERTVRTTSDADWKAEGVEVVETNANGRVTKVRVEGKTYDVCMRKDQDGCINPRAAGLNWGDRPLTYWPGEPASKR